MMITTPLVVARRARQWRRPSPFGCNSFSTCSMSGEGNRNHSDSMAASVDRGLLWMPRHRSLVWSKMPLPLRSIAPSSVCHALRVGRWMPPVAETIAMTTAMAEALRTTTTLVRVTPTRNAHRGRNGRRGRAAQCHSKHKMEIAEKRTILPCRADSMRPRALFVCVT